MTQALEKILETRDATCELAFSLLFQKPELNLSAVGLPQPRCSSPRLLAAFSLCLQHLRFAWLA